MQLNLGPVSADLYSFGWCLAEGHRYGDQRRPMGPCDSGVGKDFCFSFS